MRTITDELLESALFSANSDIDAVLKDPERTNYIRYRCLLRAMRLKEERKEVTTNENAKTVVRKY